MKFFFITGLGRSGTAFLANLLNMSINATVFHEPCKEDYQLLPLSYYFPNQEIIDNLIDIRFERITKGIIHEKGTYGEVNSLLRYNINNLKRKFDPKLILIIRDGRDFVKSAYGRLLYTGFDTHLPIYPKPNDPYSSKWSRMTRFQKICWYWHSTNEYLHPLIENHVQFEKIVEDYDYFDKNILKFIGLDFNKVIYFKLKDKRQNATPKLDIKKSLKKLLGRETFKIESLKSWKDWDSELTDQFNEICGETMKKFGYSIG